MPRPIAQDKGREVISALFLGLAASKGITFFRSVSADQPCWKIWPSPARLVAIAS